MRKAMIVLNTILEHQLRALLGRLPPWRNVASGWLAAELGKLLISLIEDSVLLLKSHRIGVLMRVAVQAAVTALASFSKT